jgi:hypothetical protein
MRRLLAGRHLPVAPLHALGRGELAALGWLVESLAQAGAAAAGGQRVLALDFESLLADTRGTLARVLTQFDLPGDEATLTAIAGSDVTRRYSKAPELPYSADERAARLAVARRDERGEIAAGLAWLEGLARADAGIAAVVAAGLP